MSGTSSLRGRPTGRARCQQARQVYSGQGHESGIVEYPQLVEEDIREALRFAAASVDQRVIPLDQTA